MVFKVKNYSWGAVQYSTPASTVGAVLEDIEKRDGHVTKESFLEESRPEESPTHGMFEWDDRKAAEKYRLTQSGTIINNLVVTVKAKETEPPKTIKAMVAVQPERLRKAKYSSIEVALSDTDTRAILLDHAKDELKQFRRKYNDLEELAGVFSEAEKIGA